jgi:hypothetical protein
MKVELPASLGSVPLKTSIDGCIHGYDFGTMYDMELNIEVAERQVKLWLFWSDSPGDTKTEQVFAFSQTEVDLALQQLFKMARKVLTEKLALEQRIMRELQVEVDRVEEALRLMKGQEPPSLWERLEDANARG